MSFEGVPEPSGLRYKVTNDANGYTQKQPIILTLSRNVNSS